MYPGEPETWEKLERANARDVVERTGVRFNRGKCCFEVDSLNQVFLVYPQKKKIETDELTGQVLLTRLSHFLKPVLLNYLLQAKNVSLSEEYVTPSGLKGGETFFGGSHELPFQGLLKMFDLENEKLEKVAWRLGGVKAEFGDLSFKLSPLPKVPVVVVFWKGDEEFPPQAKIMYDRTVELHLPLDLTWSVAMYTLLAFLVCPEE